MKIRTCHNCAREKICNLKTVFNINEDIGCVDFIDNSDILKTSTDPIYKPVMDPRYRLNTVYIGTPFVESAFTVNCKEIILRHGSIEIVINDNDLKDYPVIIINGRTYVLKED